MPPLVILGGLTGCLGARKLGQTWPKMDFLAVFFHSVVSSKLCDDWKWNNILLVSWPFNLGHTWWAWEALLAIWRPGNGDKNDKNGFFGSFFYSVVSDKLCDDWKWSNILLVRWPFNLGHTGWAWQALLDVWGPVNGDKNDQNWTFWQFFSIL